MPNSLFLSFLSFQLHTSQRLLAHFYVGGPDAIKFNEVFKSLDQKVDDLIDCLPSNGHDEEELLLLQSANCTTNNNQEGVNEPSSEPSGSSQAALDGERKEDGEKNGQKEEGGISETISEFPEEKESGITYWEKLQGSLKPNLPRDLQSNDGQSAGQAQVQEQALAHFWAFLRGLLIPAT